MKNKTSQLNLWDDTETDTISTAIAALSNRRALKILLQSDIDSNRIVSIDQLFEKIKDYNLTITRSGLNYVGLKPSGEKPFRVRFSFTNSLKTTRLKKIKHEPSRTDGCWIYALTAYSQNTLKKACYIGQTNNIIRRLKTHFQHNRPGKDAFLLFEWAENERVDVMATSLSFVFANRSHVTYHEGYWLNLALQSGFETPGIDNWGRLPMTGQFPGLPVAWPTSLIRSSEVSLRQIIDTRIISEELFIHHNES